MRKHYFMTKTEYIEIYKRQKSGGLNINDFCANESYSKSSFYYWKRKFLNGAEISKLKIDTQTINKEQDATGISPIKIKKENAIASITRPQTIAKETDPVNSEISIELPNGFKIKFKGENNTRSAVEIITKICNPNVLS